jgi:hypothetical protein
LDLILVEIVSIAYLYDENHKSVLYEFVDMLKSFHYKLSIIIC